MFERGIDSVDFFFNDRKCLFFKVATPNTLRLDSIQFAKEEKGSESFSGK